MGVLQPRLVYLAFLTLGLFVWRRAFAELLAALLGLLIGWALVAKVFALDDGRRARLNEPIGYWNTLGLLAASAVPLALRLASRTLSVLLLYGAVVSILLTQSRGGLLLATLAGAVWLVVERDRYEPALRLAVAVPPGLVVGVLGLALDGLAKDGQPHSERLADGLVLGLALVLGGALVAGLARLEVPERWLRPAAYVVVPVVALSFLLLGVRGAARLLRPGHAREPLSASQGELEQPRAVVGGGGARLRGQPGRRQRRGGVPGHAPALPRVERRGARAGVPLPLQLLTETGLVGFALFAGAAVAAGLAIRHERALVLVLALFAVGVLLRHPLGLHRGGRGHVAPTLGVLLPRGERVGRREPLWAAGVAALALAGVYSLAAPWLAERRIDQAYEAIDAGNLATGDGAGAQRPDAQPHVGRAALRARLRRVRPRTVRPRARALRARDRVAGEPGDLVPARDARVRGRAL